MDSSFDAVINAAVAEANGMRPPERVRARFATEPELLRRETEATGRPVFEPVEMIYLTVPRDPITKRRRATQDDKRRFAKEWHWYLDTEKTIADGMPIAEWSQITATKAAELKWAGVRTVEALAHWNLDERPLHSADAVYVELARQFLEGQDAKDRRIAELEARIAELESAEGLKASERRKAS